MNSIFKDQDICRHDTALKIIGLSVIGIATFIILFITVIALKGFNEMNEQNEMTIPLLFRFTLYLSLFLAAIQLVLFLISFTNCWNFGVMFVFLIYGIVITNVFVLWLLRLYYTFHRSLYEKSNHFYICISIIFANIISTAISGIILFCESITLAGRSLVILSVFGYISISIYLLIIFARQLLELITARIITLRFTTNATLRQRTSDIELSFRDQRLVNCISKYLVLGIVSISTTGCVLLVSVLDLFGVFGDNQSLILFCITMLVIVDGISNTLCIYLQFHIAHNHYKSLCHWMDNKINYLVEYVAVNKLRRKTFTFYTKDLPNAGSADEDVNDGLTPDEVPTFSQIALPNTSVSPQNTDNSDNTNAEAYTLDFDKLIDFKTIKKCTNEINETNYCEQIKLVEHMS